MIIVIADDFTGAAELAGINLRYGLSVSLCMHEFIISDHDVIIVCTDSRSLGLPEANKITAKVLEQIKDIKPGLIYKKIDSVLRGYVIDELKVQMEHTGIKKVFILPANPSLGRTIANGEYYVDGKKIDETGFALDPEFPIKSARVIEMIKDDSLLVLPTVSTLP